MFKRAIYQTKKTISWLRLMGFSTILLIALVACGQTTEIAEPPVEEVAEQPIEQVEEPAVEEVTEEVVEEEPVVEETAPSPAPETIRIGNPIALTGPNAAGAGLSQIPSYDLWVETVNADGGIYVAEYDAKIPVEIIRYDDASDIDAGVQLMEKLMLEDEVDFIFPPWGTVSNFAIAPLATQYDTPILGCTMSSLEVTSRLAQTPNFFADQFPNFFAVLNQPDTQVEGMVEVLQAAGVETVAIIRHDDLHGIELQTVIEPLLEESGIEIVAAESFPVGTEDLSPILTEMQATNPDALLHFTYPAETFQIVGTLQQIGFNPKALMGSVGVAFPIYPQIAGGVEFAEGVMGTGAWNPDVDIEGAREYFDAHVEMFGAEPDRWASAACYATGQILQQAIEMAGTLDAQAVREAIASGEFETILGTVYFENQVNQTYPGSIGQWQNGEFQIIAPAANRTADIIYPKPEWPSQ